MPGARPRIKPLSASGSSASSLDEITQLELHLQRQLEEDVARIFDESIYSDLEVVCGKLKILTHSCILKARTHKFYHKLEAILHVNIGRNTFDEIYSFISDAYTECDIQYQENEIICYLNENLNLKPTLLAGDKRSNQEDLDESETYGTPNSVTPEDSLQKTLSSSPSTELTKEYYALVPIEGQILDKELIEQDELSNAFQSFIHLRTEQLNDNKCVKPTTLSLNSSHISKLNEHSIICDISKDLKDSNSCLFENDTNKINNATSLVRKHIKSTQLALQKCNSCDTSAGAAESGYSPDSLWAEEASSSSDYLSAAQSASPPPHAAPPFRRPNMNNTISDSGIDNNAMLESLNSHKDVTLADVSLTESTFHDLLNDEAALGNDSVSEIERKQLPKSRLSHSQVSFTSNRLPSSEMSRRSSKDEKQRQNEEIVILESSSLSSETGSWESVFPPKMPEKDLCEKFISIERQCSLEPTFNSRAINATNDMSLHIAEASSKTTCCFIDAASLADEAERHQEQIESSRINTNIAACRFSSQPVPCESKQITSPNDYSESNDNDDSLEQPDPDSIQKDISPTIFEMSFAPDDSIAGKNFFLAEDSNTSNEDHSSHEGFMISEQHSSMTLESVTRAHTTSCDDYNISKPNNSLRFIPKKSNANEANSSYDNLVISNHQNSMTPEPFARAHNTSSDELKICAKPSIASTLFMTSSPDNSSKDDLMISNEQRWMTPETIVKAQQISMTPETLVKARQRSIDTSSDELKVCAKPSILSTLLMTSSTDNSSNDDLMISNEQKWMTPETVLRAQQKFMTPKTPVRAQQSSIDTSSDEFFSKSSVVQTLFMASTPDNSIISLKATDSNYESLSSLTSRPASYAAAWVVDMSKMPKPDNKHNKPPGDKACDNLRASSKSGSNSEGCKSRNSVDSDSSEKSTHKFYIDLSTLPDATAPEQKNTNEASNEKKNIFSMFIDIGENSSAVKEMPARLSSALNSKKNCKVVTKQTTTKTVKGTKKSPGILNGDDAFEKLENLCSSSQISISEILQSPIVKKIVKEQRDKDARIAPTIREEPDTDENFDVFVRLSDLDKAPAQTDSTTVAVNTECYERMTRSIPDNNWGQSSHTSSRSIDIISSFHSENALSLNRLFPHLKNDISRSMPGSLPGRTRSPHRLGVSSSYGDRDELVSDMSEMSSVQSSMCRSVVENSTTEDTSHTSSILANCQSRLGQDLLRMFVEEIAPDVIVEVSGRRIKAHKCILASRCQYFAGILSGGWVESAGNVISLPPFSYNVVHFALCHIYSGISTIPDTISIVELATIADMLGLEGLKEAIMFTLKAKYCHHFHEPCQVCTAGVLECFPLSSVYGLDELYRRCLRWITRHFRKVWPTKAFATLPSELLDKCYQEHLLNLTVHNFIDTVQDCGLTAASLQRCRWAEVVARLCQRLSRAAAQFAGARLSGVVRSVSAPRAAPPAAAARALDVCLAAAVECAPPDELCRALALLHALPEPEPCPAPDTLAALRRRCEGALLRAAPLARAAPAFRDLPADLRRRLRRSCDAPSPAPAATPPSARRAPSAPAPAPAPAAAAAAARIERVRTSFVPYAQRPPPPAQARARPVPPRVRSTKAQEERAKFNMTKSFPAKPRDSKAAKTRASYENAKPRYMEPRPGASGAAGAGGAGGAGGAARKPLPRLASSSESSRNQSPVLASRPRTANPSTDSLSDSLYATYTKSRTRRNDTTTPSTQPVKCDATRTHTVKKATKIPVYLNQNIRKRGTAAGAGERNNTSKEGSERSLSARHRGSLMSATKSSSAKMVPKIIKEQLQTQKVSKVKCTRSPSLADIPAMERSGTFLKDEPTFGDKTTNIDIDG